MQVTGMWGLARTVPRTLGWALRLLRGQVTRESRPPEPRPPLRGVGDTPASHVAAPAEAAMAGSPP